MIVTPQLLVQQYRLQPHPEGGWYKETYRSNEAIAQNSLPARFSGSRAFSTAIYFLLEEGNFSAFHRIQSDECWHFYYGDPLWIYIIFPSGNMEIIQLGNDFSRGQQFQYVVPAGCWFASRPAPESRFSFVGCTVAPGFDFADFEMAEVNALQTTYPQHEKLIQELCR
ncbi:MAG: cupin domain-containing protein [Bacteroidetes bacterium]|nr:cupin domain-containing protein [Bacteroidota bacterium]